MGARKNVFSGIYFRIGIQKRTRRIETFNFSEYREAITAPHFVMWIRQQLEEKYGPELIQRGGLKVITTLDVNMQQKAEEAVQASREKNAEQYGAKNAHSLP